MEREPKKQQTVSLHRYRHWEGQCQWAGLFSSIKRPLPRAAEMAWRLRRVLQKSSFICSTHFSGGSYPPVTLTTGIWHHLLASVGTCTLCRYPLTHTHTHIRKETEHFYFKRQLHDLQPVGSSLGGRYKEDLEACTLALFPSQTPQHHALPTSQRLALLISPEREWRCQHKDLSG